MKFFEHPLIRKILIDFYVRANGVAYGSLFYSFLQCYIVLCIILFDSTLHKDFSNYKDEALEIYPTIVYACTAVF